jgi:uncharacterized protein (TIGR02444 family)
MNLLCKEKFWHFACQFYALSEQKNALLSFQNKQGKNINLCLLLYYLDSLKLQINDAQLKILQHSIYEFDLQVLQPLRNTRHYLKQNQNNITEYTKIRKQLLSTELMLEKQQQHILIETLNSQIVPHSDKPNNLILYK